VPKGELRISFVSAMQVQEAKALIAGDGDFARGHWADLGCGSGTFTCALAELLPAGSHIHAIDREPQRLPAEHAGIPITFHQADLTERTIELPPLTGILAANFLHFLPGPGRLIASLDALFVKGKGTWVVVEYDRRTANPYVPHPLPFERLRALFPASAFHAQIVGRRASAFGGQLYCAHIRPR
jgi:hypothetical protein